LEQVRYVKCTLLCFKAASGLMVNLEKSEMVQIGQVSNLTNLVAMLEGKISNVPMKYLGMPLGARFKSKLIWDPILEKLGRKLAGWKHLYLSKGGRLTLLKSMLSGLPLYYLSLYPIPVSAAHHIEKLQRDFLWGGMDNVSKFPLVNWKNVCMPIAAGCLGIKNLIHTNQALLGKWLWRFATEKNSYWRKVVALKYGVNPGNWMSEIARGPYGISLWKHIRKGWAKFYVHTKFEVGNGNCIRF
jgi:hypothetical protein